MSPQATYVVEIDQVKCDGCDLCVDFCPVKVFSKENGMVKPAKIEACYACDTCIDLCSKKAIKIIKL